MRVLVDPTSLRSLFSSVAVESFGAVGDGVADDTKALRRAFAVFLLIMGTFMLYQTIGGAAS